MKLHAELKPSESLILCQVQLHGATLAKATDSRSPCRAIVRLSLWPTVCHECVLSVFVWARTIAA